LSELADQLDERVHARTSDLTAANAHLHREGRCLRLRHSEEARDAIIMIPLFHGMTEAEQDHVLAALRALPT